MPSSHGSQGMKNMLLYYVTLSVSKRILLLFKIHLPPAKACIEYKLEGKTANIMMETVLVSLSFDRFISFFFKPKRGMDMFCTFLQLRENNFNIFRTDTAFWMVPLQWCCHQQALPQEFPRFPDAFRPVFLHNRSYRALLMYILAGGACKVLTWINWMGQYTGQPPLTVHFKNWWDENFFKFRFDRQVTDSPHGLHSADIIFTALISFNQSWNFRFQAPFEIN